MSVRHESRTGFPLCWYGMKSVPAPDCPGTAQKPNKHSLPGCGQAACDKSSMSPVHELRQNGFPHTAITSQQGALEHARCISLLRTPKRDCYNGVNAEAVKGTNATQSLVGRHQLACACPKLSGKRHPARAICGRLGAKRDAPSLQRRLLEQCQVWQSIPYPLSLVRATV